MFTTGAFFLVFLSLFLGMRSDGVYQMQFSRNYNNACELKFAYTTTWYPLDHCLDGYSSYRLNANGTGFNRYGTVQAGCQNQFMTSSYDFDCHDTYMWVRTTGAETMPESDRQRLVKTSYLYRGCDNNTDDDNSDGPVQIQVQYRTSCTPLNSDDVCVWENGPKYYVKNECLNETLNQFEIEHNALTAKTDQSYVVADDTAAAISVFVGVFGFLFTIGLLVVISLLFCLLIAINK